MQNKPCAAILTLSLLCVAAPALAQQPQQTQRPQQNKPELFGPGDVDAQMTLSVAPFFGLSAEPAVDVGLVPLPADITLSLGASLGVEHCLGCYIFDLVGLRVRYSSFKPMARVLAHIGAVSTALNLPELDFYAGATGGLGYYRMLFAIPAGQDSLRSNQVAFGAGPLVGVHFFINKRVYLGAEGRYLLWLGTNVETLTLDGETYEIDTSSYIRSGMNYTFHLGFRI